MDGVDDDDFGLMLFQRRLNGFHADFGKQVYAFGGQFQTLCTQGDLLGGFLTGNVQHFAALRHFGDGLLQQRGFADTGGAAEQDDRAIYQTAAQYAVEFAHACRITRHFGRGNGGEGLDGRGVCRPRLETGVFRLGRGKAFLKRVPLAAMRTFDLLLAGSDAAFTTLVDGFGGFCHGLLFSEYLVRRPSEK